MASFSGFEFINLLGHKVVVSEVYSAFVLFASMMTVLILMTAQLKKGIQSSFGLLVFWLLLDIYLGVKQLSLVNSTQIQLQTNFWSNTILLFGAIFQTFLAFFNDRKPAFGQIEVW